MISLSNAAYIKAPQSPNGPTVKDDKLVVEKVTDGLDIPTSMAFLGPAVSIHSYESSCYSSPEHSASPVSKRTFS